MMRRRRAPGTRLPPIEATETGRCPCWSTATASRLEDFQADRERLIEARAAAGVTTLVDDLTRVRQFRASARSASATPTSTVRRAPTRKRRREIDVTRDLVKLRSTRSGRDRRSRARYHYHNSPREAQRTASSVTSRPRAHGLPLVNHAREADADIAAIPERGGAEGDFRSYSNASPPVPPARTESRWVLRLFVRIPPSRNPTPFAPWPPSCRSTACWWRPMPLSSRPTAPRTAGMSRPLIVETAKVLADTRQMSLRDCPRHDRQFHRLFQKCRGA